MDLKLWWIKFKLEYQFDIPEQLEFLEYFESFVSDGKVSTVKALDSVQETYVEIYGKSHIVNLVCARMKNAMKEGVDMKDIMAFYFHPNIAVGYELAQKTTDGTSASKELVELVNIERSVKREMIGKLTVPFIVITIGICAQIFTGKIFIPKIELLTKNISDSIEVELSKFISTIFVDYGLFLIIIIVALIVTYQQMKDNYTGIYRGMLDKIWPFNIYRMIWGVRVLKLTGLLKKAGQRDINAYRLLKKHGNPYVNKILEKMIEGVQSGANRKEYFAKGLLEKTQTLRLNIATSQSDEAFTSSLINVADKAAIDIRMVNSRVLARWVFILMFLGIAFLAMALGSIIEAMT